MRLATFTSSISACTPIHQLFQEVWKQTFRPLKGPWPQSIPWNWLVKCQSYWCHPPPPLALQPEELAHLLTTPPSEQGERYTTTSLWLAELAYITTINWLSHPQSRLYFISVHSSLVSVLCFLHFYCFFCPTCTKFPRPFPALFFTPPFSLLYS